MAAVFNRLEISFLLNGNARGQFPQPPWLTDGQTAGKILPRV
jgi:hypothetical protein